MIKESSVRLQRAISTGGSRGKRGVEMTVGGQEEAAETDLLLEKS